MSADKRYVYFGTNPVVRVGGDNTLAAFDSSVPAAGRGRTAGAGWPMQKLNQFGANLNWDVKMSHFVDRTSRAALEQFVNRQRRDVFGRTEGQPHDLFLSYRPGDYEWVALRANDVNAINTEDISPSSLVTGAAGTQAIPVVLGDLSYWSQDQVKTGSWSLYNTLNTGAYRHYVPTTDTMSNWITATSPSKFTFMGWIRPTGSAFVNQTIIRKQQQYILAFTTANQLSFSFAGTNQTFSPVFPLAGANRWLFIAIRKITGAGPNNVEMYYGWDWESTLNGPFIGTVGNSVSTGDTNQLAVGNGTSGSPQAADGSAGFQGYLGAMVMADVTLTAANLEAEFDRTKVGDVAFSDPADPAGAWVLTYAPSPAASRVLYWKMDRVTSFSNGVTAITNLMLSKVYNVFYGNTTPANGAILLDHGTFATTHIGSLFVPTTVNGGLGDRLFFGQLSDFTDDLGYSTLSEIVYVDRKAITNAGDPTSLYDSRRIEILPVALPTGPPGGFRQTHLNGQSMIVKFKERFPAALPEDITPEEVQGLQRGRMRRVDYVFPCERFPFHDIDAKNYDDVMDLQYAAFPP